MEDIRFTSDEEARKNNQTVLERVSVIWLVFLFASYLLAVGGVFRGEVVISLAVFTVLGTILLLWKLRPSRKLTMIGAWAVVFSILTSFPIAPSVFSGRDQGSYAEAALRLAKEHSLISKIPSAQKDFFRIYGEGKALNFPGFSYRADGLLETQFPLGYIVWLAANEALFKVAGISIANIFTLFFSLMLIFLFLRRFLEFPFAAGGTAVAALSFPFLWIADSALSENLAATVFLLVAFHLVSFLEKPSAFSWWLTVFSGIFLFLTRIEGFFIFAFVFVIAFLHYRSRSYLKGHFLSATLPTVVVSGIFFSVSLVSNFTFYKTVGKALVESFSFSAGSASSGMPLLAPLFRNMEIFWTYGIISVFALAVLGIIFLFSQRHFLRATPFFLALPTFLYLVSPHISSDHPWMLRRFAFSVWSTVIILAMFAIAHLQKFFHEKYPEKALFRPALFSLFFSSLLILPAIPATASTLFFSENENLLTDVETLSKNFSEKDLVLVDRLASGDPYAMIADPMSTLFDINAVYFFNPDDLNQLDFSQFKQVYLMVRDGDEAPYRSAFGSHFTLEPAHSYALRTSALSRETDPSHIPTQKNEIAHGIIFLIVPKE